MKEPLKLNDRVIIASRWHFQEHGRVVVLTGDEKAVVRIDNVHKPEGEVVVAFADLDLEGLHMLDRDGICVICG